jgi:hypothetical protein
MRRAAAKSTVDILQKIESIEKEAMELELTVLKDLTPTGKKTISSGVLLRV